MSDSESDTSDEHSSSECSTDSSDDDKLETVQLASTQLRVPQGLCEKKDIFAEFFQKSWSMLSEASQQRLRQFLPAFPENEQREQNITLQRLFTGDSFRFTNPLDDFFEHLKAGHYRPDIAKMRYLIRKAERKESLWRHRKFKERLRAEIVESRQKLLRQASQMPPGVEPRLQRPLASSASGSKLQNPIYNRTKRRYFETLAAIKSQLEESGFSSDDNYPEGPPTPVSRKDKRLLNSLRNSHVLNGEKMVASTNAMLASGLDLERNLEPNRNPYIVTETSYKSLLKEHRKRKFDHLLQLKVAPLLDAAARTKMTQVKREKAGSKPDAPPKAIKNKKIKKEMPDRASFSSELYNSADSDTDSFAADLPSNSVPAIPPVPPQPAPIPPPVVGNSLPSSKAAAETKKKVKVEPETGPTQPAISTPPRLSPSSTPAQGKHSEKVAALAPQPIKTEAIKTESVAANDYMAPATLTDLDGIDMMKLPIDLHNSHIDIMDEISTKIELMQDTHANFLALIRDIFCGTPEHRVGMPTLEEKLKTWQSNPITALNDWYCLAENWTAELQSAVNFLSGNFPEQPDEFVPYMEYKPALSKYQWIGAGRDSDASLAPLFQYWIEHKSEMKPVISIKEKEDDKDDIELDLERSLTPPPPRCPTDWQVRKADTEEVRLFREQECQRYDNPHKSFTYRCNGYESVVGPLKGIYSPSASSTKARGHTMLTADRPNFVTILSLVRDATARLPNGEGTRGEICELLKCSQYISNAAPDNLLQSVVSGALDRMHTQFDPCVKYDPKRKIWIYLHRNRSEEDFERLHQQYQGMNRSAKKKKSPLKPKAPKVDKKASSNAAKSNAADGEAQKSKEKAAAASQKQTSLLLSQHMHNNHTQQSLLAKNYKVEALKEESKEENADAMIAQPVEVSLADEKEMNQALQSITQPKSHSQPQVVQVLQSPKALKKSKSLVKIIAANQSAKSLIIPSSASAMLKQESRAMASTTKLNQASPMVAQQLLQNIAQQKQIGEQLFRVELPSQKEAKKSSLSIQQQILQSISPQQLQNIKNVTLLRNVRQGANHGLVLAHSDEASGSSKQSIEEKPDAGSGSTHVIQQGAIRMQTAGSLSLSQQQQLLQTIRQKGLAQQQLLIRHKSPGTPKNSQAQAAPGTSLLGPPKVLTAADVNASAKSMPGPGQAPIVAKVLTNAAGQVISVESLLAHQKQHGSLPQGTTVRVSGVKGGANIIQLGSPQNKTSQVAASQNNFITLANQPKLVLSSTTNAITTVTGGKSMTKTVSKPANLAKFAPKVAQQIINAKFMTQNVDGQKIVQPKMIIGQNQIKLASMSSKSNCAQSPASNSNSIRMVNAGNLNLAHLGGKPLLLASKGTSLQSIQGQNVIIQTQANTSNNSLLVTAKNNANANAVNVVNQGGQQMLLAPQLKMQPQMVLSSSVKNASMASNQTGSNQLLVGGHPVRLTTSSASSTQRVVLASQGQSGQLVAQQILLPAGFQGTAINIKSLQGVKVIPIAQQAKGVQGRQVFARVMNPSNVIEGYISRNVPANESDAEVHPNAPTND